MKLDVLAIGAHPDDIELSCGGTVIKLTRQGKKVGLVDITDGELGTRGNRDIRAAEAAEAGRLLGVSIRVNLSLPDAGIEASPANVRKLAGVIRAFKPEVLFIPHAVDRHPDHEHAHILAREAWFYAGLRKMEAEYEGKLQEAYRPRAYYHFMQWFEFTPSFIVDITDEFDQRMTAVRAFRSQFFDPDSREPETILSTPEFIEMLHTRLAYYGDKINRKYGEPFFSPVALHVPDVFALNTQ